ARAQPGVLTVLTARDIEQEVEPIRAPCSYPTYQETPQDLLARDKVRLVGEPVAVVVAENRYAAEDVAELVTVSYEPLEPVTSIEQAMAPGAPAVHDTAPDNVHVSFDRVSGDVEQAFAQADFTVELELRTQRYAAVCLEPRA